MKCTICEIGCDIAEGRTGRCRMYKNINGVLCERFPDSYLTLLPITIETMPMVHFAPKSKFFQVSTIGCNFTCPGCISEILTSHDNVVAGALRKATPQEVIMMAKKQECQGIVFCLNDPTVSYYSFCNLATQAKKAGMFVGCSTNGYFTENTVLSLIPLLDFINIGLKGSSDKRYRECGVPSGEPVFRNIRLLHEAGIHVEVSAMYVNGADDEILNAAEKIAAISQDIPMQVMRFVPFGEAAPDLEPTIAASEVICTRLQKILNYVYLFNSPGSDFLNTICPRCGATIISREFYGPMGCRTISAISDATCACGWQAPICGEISEEQYTEYGMLGGYRTTRAIEMAHAILVTLGLSDDEELGSVLEVIIRENFIRGMHDRIQQIDTWTGLIKDLAARSGHQAEGQALIEHIQSRVDIILTGSAKITYRPRVYYSMGYPLFALNAERFETNLVQAAGGLCVNKLLEKKGKPGVNISADELQALNPEYIFISGFLSSPASDSSEYCKKHGITIDAVRDQRIYNVPTGWDFGSPRWILGFMFIANKIHPEQFSFDLEKEQKEFYEKFYGITTETILPNRDFSRPSFRG